MQVTRSYPEDVWGVQWQAYRAAVVLRYLQTYDPWCSGGLQDSLLTMTDNAALLRVAAQTSAIALFSITLNGLFLAPLARLPGLALSALTRVPLIFTGRRSAWIYEIYVKYGPVVHVAPDEVSFAMREAAKEFYMSGDSGVFLRVI